MERRRPVRGFTIRGTAVLAALGFAFAASPAAAQPKPGDKIDKSNVAAAKGFINPGLEWCVQHGMVIPVTDYKKIEWPPAYREATEKFSAQVKLGPNGLTIENYVAGQPFPLLDPNDPQLATKIMWNYEYKWLVTDDLDSRNFDADTGPIFGGDTPLSVERHFLIDHVRALRFIGRLYNDPKPTIETKEGYQGKAGLYPILEPFDLKGVGGLTHRYIDPSKYDDTWLYLPSLRRVRRLSTAQRSDALFGQDIDIDSFTGYAGHIAWMDWKFLGEKQVLGAWHGKNFPAKWQPGGADFAFDDVWEMRPTYVIEGVSKLAQYAYGKRIIYIDKETYGVSVSDLYDRAGNLWKTYANLVTMRKAPFDGAKKTYDFEQPFGTGVFMVDTQLNHATRVSLPSAKFPGEEGHYFNMGKESGTIEDWFAMAKLIAAGR